MRKSLLFILVLILQISCTTTPKSDDIQQPPGWAKSVIWYQIFVERFNNGDAANDPKPENIASSTDFNPVPDDWQITAWTQNWYQEDNWAVDLNGDFYSKLQHRRYGGDLQGVLDKLDYLEELGITAIYFNPINDAPSLHKYDARNYRHIDVNFGPDPKGDQIIMASENPGDPKTWKWTSADKMFLHLVDELHQRGIRVILDYSWNHTGMEFWAMQDVIENQESSPYHDWYDITSFDDPNTVENEFDYHAWVGIKSLPELRKINLTTERIHGHPYEGNINEGAKKHIFEVTKRWLAPDGDTAKGIDGYRLDVAEQIGLGFWRDYRKFVKSINPEAYLIGEIWWEKWPDQLMDPSPYLQGDIFDAVMFYHIYKQARYFFAETERKLDAVQLRDSLLFEWGRVDQSNQYAMMNTAATHDAPRLLTSFNNSGLYKVWAKPNDDANYKTGKPDSSAYKRVKLYLMHQFTIPGAPQIWNGDEMGMWGADDPDCRKPLWWKELDFEEEYHNNFQAGEKEFDLVGFNEDLFNFYKQIITIRKENPILATGDIEFTLAEGNRLAYKRFDANNEILVLFNMEATPQTFDLAEGSYTNLLDKSFANKSIELQPGTGAILHRTN